MEYVQERIATLHDLTGVDRPPAVDERVLGETAVIVPMTGREHASLAAERVLSELEALDPAAVFVPVRAAADRIDDVRTWLDSFDLNLTALWCGAPAVDEVLAEAGLAGGFGKGRDVWLALGPAAARCEHVVVHDADATNYDASQVTRLLAPVAGDDFSFVKGYYARVESGRLYGRLCRLFYEPVVRALRAERDAPILSYLGAFRYALAGEFACSAALARQIRAPRAWGLEVGILGDAFDYAGFERSAQVDLGTHEHDHRAVAGDTGLEGMSRQVAATLFRVLEDAGVSPDYETLPERYRTVGDRLIDRYAADAAFNDLAYDAAAEREQVDRYARAIDSPGPDRRLPAWADAPIEPEAVVAAATPWRD